MSSFKVYRYYSKTGPDSKSDRNDYRFSLVVTEGMADFVVPTASAPGELASLRDNLNTAMEQSKKRGFVPVSVVETAEVASSNVGTYFAFTEVFSSSNNEDSSLNFLFLRDQEQDLIDNWISYGKEPSYVSV